MKTTITNILDYVDVSPDSTITKTVHSDEFTKSVLFAFAAGQELSEHTASTPAMLHFLSGKSTVILDGETHTALAGTWIHMPARLPHSIKAESDVKMLLILVKIANS